MGAVIRISEKDKIKLESFSKVLGKKSLGKTFSEVIQFVEKRKDEFLSERLIKEGEEPMLELLRSTGRFGKSDSRRVDEYVYGAQK